MLDLIPPRVGMFCIFCCFCIVTNGCCFICAAVDVITGDLIWVTCGTGGGLQMVFVMTGVLVVVMVAGVIGVGVIGCGGNDCLACIDGLVTCVTINAGVGGSVGSCDCIGDGGGGVADGFVEISLGGSLLLTVLFPSNCCCM